MNNSIWKACCWITLAVGVLALFSGLFVPAIIALGCGGYGLYMTVDN